MAKRKVAVKRKPAVATKPIPTMAPRTDDDLLDELSGDMLSGVVEGNEVAPTVEKVAGDFQEKEKDPLEVDVKGLVADRKAANTKKAQDVLGYEVEVSGDYIAHAKEGRGKIKKSYSIKLRLPSMEAAASVIKNKLLARALRAQHGDFLDFRTHKIGEVTPLTNDTPLPTNIKFMTRKQLESYVTIVKVPIKASDYAALSDLRDIIVDFTVNPLGFAKREVKKAKDLAETAELEKMNPGLDG